jgi:cobalt-zinc-cadmium efflux system membrane fusion protein
MLAVLLGLVAMSCRSDGDSHDEPAAHDDDHDHDAHDHDGQGHDSGVVELEPEALATVTLRTAAVEKRALRAEVEATGVVDFDQPHLAHVSPRLPGRVTDVLVELGHDVKRGDPLVRLDSIELGQARSAYLQARTREDLARATSEREQQLARDRISPQQDALAAESALREASAARLAAEQTLALYGLGPDEIRALKPEDGRASLLVVRSPLDGRIVDMHATLGELVTPEDRLMTVAQLARVWVWVDVPERDLSRVHVDDIAHVVADAHPGDAFEGTVSYLTDQVDAATRTARARVEVANPERKLLPGMFARVRIVDVHAPGGGGDASLVVPAEAVQRLDGENVAFVVLGPGRFARRDVDLGLTVGGSTQVIAGLAEGETVVTEGSFVLKSESARHELGGGHSH